MNARVKTLSAVYLLLVCLPVAAQPDILSAVPGDAYGFAATKNLQGSYDKIMAFAQAMGIPASDENQLLTIHEHLGQVDLGRGRSYINTGSWMLEPAFAEIADGQVELKPWPAG